MLSPEDVINYLGLEPLPLEGGFFRESYRSAYRFSGDDRAFATAIYFLITPDNCSRMHQLKTDELFHFYLGDPAEQLHLYPDGTGRVVQLGTDLAAGQRPQALVRGGTWQGTRLADGGRFALLGTTMAPGFAPAEYRHGDRADLSARWAAFAPLIEKLTAADEALEAPVPAATMAGTE